MLPFRVSDSVSVCELNERLQFSADVFEPRIALVIDGFPDQRERNKIRERLYPNDFIGIIPWSGPGGSSTGI